MISQATAYKRLGERRPVFAVYLSGQRVGLHTTYDAALDQANELNLEADPNGWDTPATIRDWATGAV